jgi:hypothetical protein
MKAEEVIPFLDAVGPEGVFLHALADSESTARRVLDQAEKHRSIRHI